MTSEFGMSLRFAHGPCAIASGGRVACLDTHRLIDTVRAFWRWIKVAVGGWPADVAVVPTGWPTAWFRGRTLIQVTSDGFLVREIRRGKVFKDAVRCLWVGSRLIFKVGFRKRTQNELPPAPKRQAPTTH